jgi:hypothetical protein
LNFDILGSQKGLKNLFDSNSKLARLLMGHALRKHPENGHLRSDREPSLSRPNR